MIFKYFLTHDLSYLRHIGSVAFAKTPKELLGKLTSGTEKLFLLGYRNSIKAYQLVDPFTDKILESHDIIFVESEVFPKDAEHLTIEILPPPVDNHPQNDDLEADVPNNQEVAAILEERIVRRGK
ncbi:hypothetical protein HMI54_009361 [Coelomomyces lativittatus]|nr:hypothetical protein HMI56_004478 [Coelomomyces lativittatus]KAJ1502079.1 hypothetical protein HMI54_009361 [Coelomomyces lativittatus]